MADFIFLDALIDDWLACSPSAQAQWLQEHCSDLNLDLLQHLKARSDALLLVDPRSAEQITQGMLMIAVQLVDEPLAYPLACWARGNWALYHEPKAAVSLYRSALTGYRPTGNPQFIVRLLSNLIASLSEVGELTEAITTYQEITQWQEQLQGNDRFYLLSPAQNYALLLHDLGNYHNALQAHLYARALAVTFQAIDRIGEIDVNRALSLARLGQLSASEQLLLTSREIAAAEGHKLTVARIDMNLGDLYTAQARPAEAFRRFQAAQQQFMQLDNDMELASVLLREADLLTKLGAVNESRRYFAQAQQRFAEHEMWTQVGLSLLGGGIAHRLDGRYARAGHLLEQALALWQKLNHTEAIQLAQLEQVALALAKAAPNHALADLQHFFPTPPNVDLYPQLSARYYLYLAEAQTALWKATTKEIYYQQAQDAYQQALTIGEIYHDHAARRQALVGLAQLSDGRDASLTRSRLEQALSYDEWIHQELSVQELKASFLYRTTDLLPHLVRLMLDQHDPVQALRYAWRDKGRALLDLFYAAENATFATTQTASAVDQTLAETRRQLTALQWETRLKVGHIMPEPVLDDSQPAIQQLKQKIQALRRQRNSALGLSTSMTLLQPNDLLTQMGADYLLEYVRCGDELWLICGDQQSNLRAIYLTDVETIQNLLVELQLAFKHILARSLDQRIEGLQRWLNECRPLLARCHTLLFSSLGSLPTGSRLLIAPCEPLYKAPFAAFWNGTRYAVEEYWLEMIPTGALLVAPKLQPATGQPIIVASTAEGKLPSARVEALTIQQLLPASRCLIDETETVNHLQHLPTAPRFLHIAAHTTPGDIPLFTAFHLAGEFLSVEQCYDLPLRGTQLVTLSGCATIMGMESGGALLALQSAFMLAGAQRIISTLWQIDDSATSAWMTLFYQFLSNGLTPPDALRQAQLAFLADPHYEHPVFWAPFVCTRR